MLDLLLRQIIKNHNVINLLFLRLLPNSIYFCLKDGKYNDIKKEEFFRGVDWDRYEKRYDYRFS